MDKRRLGSAVSLLAFAPFLLDCSARFTSDGSKGPKPEAGATNGSAGESGDGGTTGGAGESGSAGIGGSGGGSGSSGSSGSDSGGSGPGVGGADSGGGTGGQSGGTGGALCGSSDPVELSEVPGRSITPRAAWTGDSYGVVWQDDRDGNPEIYFARLDSAGRKLGTDVRVTNAPGESAAPSLVWVVSEFGLTWHDERDGNTEIYFVRLDPAGQKIGPEVRLTTDSARSEFPSLVWRASEYAVAWNDARDGGFQIYFARLGQQGAKLAPEVRVSGDTTLAASPSLAAGPGGFGVAWHDLRGG